MHATTRHVNSRDLLQCSMPLPHNPSRPEQRQRQAQAACPYDARTAQRRPCRIGLHPARVQEKPAEETTREADAEKTRPARRASRRNPRRLSARRPPARPNSLTSRRFERRLRAPARSPLAGDSQSLSRRHLRGCSGPAARREGGCWLAKC